MNAPTPPDRLGAPPRADAGETLRRDARGPLPPDAADAPAGGGPSDPLNAGPADVRDLLDEPARRPLLRQPWPWVAALLIAGSVAGLMQWQARQEAAARPVYTTQPVTRGPIALTVTANGTLQPTRTIGVGSELSGTVAQVLADVNDRVTKGQVLVMLDTARLRDQITRSQASLAAATARVSQAQATVREAQATLGRFEEVWRLSGGKVPSQAELDSARAALQRAQAEERSARASVTDAQAALSSDQTNLGKAAIRSPADGVVLTRSVDPGNAVAASLQAVTLFTIAEDLRQLRLQVNVDEADVGTVRAGQQASFTVSAYPARQYPARITRVAYGSTTTDNVVTYPTQLDVDNADLSLRPGMTATATIEAVQRTDALRVPNAALRFEPAVPGAGAPAANPRGGAGGNRGIVGSLIPQRPPGFGRRPGGGGATTRGNDASGAPQQRQVYVLRDGAPVPLTITTGISDGRYTEVLSGELQAGMAVIVDQKSGSAG
jgi:HlyD family secretion protein